MRPFRSIRAQLAASVGLLVLVIVALAGVVIVAQMDTRDRAVLDAQLRARAERVGEDLSKVIGDHGASRDEYGDLLAGSQSLVRVIVDGVVVAERGEVPDEQIPAPTVDGLSTILVDGEEWRSLVVVDGSGVDVQVLQSLSPLNQRLTANAWLVTAVTIIATLLAIAGGWLIASVILQPLRALTRGAQHIRDAHHIEDRMPRVSTPAEVAELSETLNDMLERLERSTNATRRFTADAGHELRTPLAAAAAALEVIQRNPELGAAERHALLDSAGADVARTTALLDGLQRLARGDAGALPTREMVDVADLAADAVRTAQRRHPSIRYELDDQAPADSAPLLVWRDGIRLAIDNLLDNAAHHGRENGHVRVTIHTDASTTTVTVADDGPGIPPDQRSTMRERFARGKDVRGPGSGLGLALVDQQAALHGGEFILEQSEPGGLSATLALPTPSSTS
jgi:signal transduction histidine kinase